MQLRLLNFSSLVQTMAAATQAASTQLLDLTIGSVLRAILEANAGIALWLQWLIVRVLRTTRAGTSTGVELDSWMADFSVTRQPAVAATGCVTFSRLTPGLVARIPVGALARTVDGSQTYAVIADPTIAAFDPTTQAFALAADATAIDLPAQALTAGSAGNALPGTIGLLATAIPGVDAVSNIAAMQGGQDAEDDAALRARFQNFIDTRSRATARAVGYAIGGIQQGLQYVIAENTDAAGNPRPGNFVVVVDDGSGTPSAALLGSVAAAIEAVRPIGSVFTVQPPAVLTVSIALTLSLAAGANQADAATKVATAITGFANTLPIGAALTRSRIAQLAHDADAAVLNTTNILLNGVPADITPPARTVIKPASVATGA